MSSDEKDHEIPEEKHEGGAEGEAGATKKKKNKNKKKKKNKPAAEGDAPTEAASMADIEAQKLIEKLNNARIQEQIARKEEGKSEYAFWDTQPVPKLSESVDFKKNEAIIPKYEDIRQEPYNLPGGYTWCNMDVEDEKEMQEIYTLLNENYVEDDDNMFRFDYAIPFLQWALKPPGWLKEWHVGVRTAKGKLVGFITAIPAEICTYGKVTPMVEINFLCVHKKWRSARLAPVLIKEVTRRVHVQGRFQAVYTAGVVLPSPVGRCRYYHRSLNPKKLIDVGFSRLSRRMTMKMTVKLYAVPAEPQIPGFREMREEDVPQCTKLLNKYLKTRDLYQVFDEAEVRHWLLPRPGVINSFVVENPGSKKITDMCSFYTLPSTIIGNQKYSQLVAAYSYYNVANTVPWKDLMQDALTVAKQLGFDVFNALDLMDNKQFLEELKFGAGDGNLQYYLYNWACPNMPTEKVGLVLL